MVNRVSTSFPKDGRSATQTCILKTTTTAHPVFFKGSSYKPANTCCLMCRKPKQKDFSCLGNILSKCSYTDPHMKCHITHSGVYDIKKTIIARHAPENGSRDKKTAHGTFFFYLLRYFC